MTCIVIDTDAGGDPDDAVALAIAASLRGLRVVTTCDELAGGQRARFVDDLLLASGRPEVVVAQGQPLRDRPDFFRSIAPTTANASGPLIDAVPALARLARESEEVLWVGLGPMTNLARLSEVAPGVMKSFRVVQMGGTLDATAKPEHNFRVDPSAAEQVLATFHDVTLVPTDLTYSARAGISRHHPLFTLMEFRASRLGSLVVENFDWWFSARHALSYQHDAVTLAIALDAVEHSKERRRLGVTGSGACSPDGLRSHTVVRDLDWAGFWRWAYLALAREPDSSLG